MKAEDTGRQPRLDPAPLEAKPTLQQLLDNSTTVRVFAKDLEGRYLFVNRAFEQHVGRPAAEIVGLTPGDIVPAEVAAGLRANDRRVVETGIPLEVEETNVIRGERRTLLANKFPLLGPDGRPYAVCGISIDITERKRTEEALRRAALAVSTAAGATMFETLVRQLADILGAGAAMISVFFDARRTHMRSLAACLDGRVLGGFEYEVARSPCAGVMGQDFRYVREGVHPEFAPGTRFAENGFDSYAAYSLNATSGEQLGLIVVMDRQPLAERALTEALLKIFAVRAAAEIERARADEAVRASEEQYRAIFNASADALVLWNSELKRVDVNPAYERLYGFAREEVLNATYPDHLPLEYVERRRELVRRTLAGEPCQAELEALRKNGERFHIEVRTIPIQHRGEPHVLAIVRDITARKRAEEALKSSEEQYRAIFNASVDGLLLWDAAHRIVDVNEAFLSLHGYRRDELVGEPRPVFIPPELERECAVLLPKVLAGTPCRLEARTQRKDGTTFDVEIHGIPVRYQGGPHVLVIVRDVTEAKRAEERLRASEQRYRLLFEMESDAILVVDAESLRLLDANRAAESLWGYGRAELLAMTAADLSADPEQTRSSIQSPEGRVYIPLRYHRRRDGTVFPIEITSNRLWLDGRKIVISTIRDITERKRAEDALRLSEEQYRAIFDATADALVLRDAEFRIVDVNAAYCSMSGYAREEVLGADYVVANPRAIDGHVKALHRQALVGEPIQFEAEWVRKDGARSEVEVRGVPIQHQGRPHVLYIGRDIAARKRAEAERLALEAQLRQAQKMEAIGQLTGGIAHDFNNILTSIVGYVTLATERDGAAGDPKLAGYLEQATRSCRRARDLIQQMLTFSRGQRGERRPVDLKKLVAESARLLHSSMPATLDLQTSNDESVPLASLDPVQAEQVLLNLCINARDALQGHGRVRVSVRRARHAAVCASCRSAVDGEFVELAVRDNGPGIPPEVMERMFEPFYSTKEVGKGSGMGLAMVHGIVHDHGGHLLVETAPGRGATFRVLFPALRADEPDAEHETLTGFTLPARTQKLRGRVLLVDDEEMVRGFMRELLAGWGLEVSEAANGVEACMAFAGAPDGYDVVITDQTMPRLTGMELAREVLALRPGVPVILYSGYADAITEAQVHAVGIRALVRKPVEPAALRALLASLLPAAAPAA
jgi:PAS domain S-box-containing protein